MVETALYTRDGEYVATVLAPRFVIPSDGIQWGSRTFFLKDGKYLEGFMYWIPPLRCPPEGREVEAV